MNESEKIELFDKYSDGVISEEEAAALLDLYRNNPEELKQAARELAVHDLLESVARQEDLGQRIKRSVASHEDSSVANERVKTRVIKALNRKQLVTPVGGSRREPRRFAPILLAVAASALIAVGVWRFGVEKVSEHPVAQPQVFVSSASSGAMFVRGGTALPVDKGTELKAGDLLRTGKGSSVVVEYAGEATSVELGESGEILLAGDAAGKRIKLNNGRISATVARQKAGQPMVFQTRDLEATVLGTRLELATAVAASRLDVIDGKVNFAFIGSTNVAVVSAGEYAEARVNQGEIIRYGEVLFNEDFRNGLTAWDVMVNDKPAEGSKKDLVSIVDMNGQPGRKCLQLNANSMPPDQTVEVQHKKIFGEPGIALLIEYSGVDQAQKGKAIGMSWNVGVDGVDGSASSRTLIDKPVPPMARGIRYALRCEYLIRRTWDRHFILEERTFRSGDEVSRVETTGTCSRQLTLRPGISVKNGILQVYKVEIRRIECITRNK